MSSVSDVTLKIEYNEVKNRNSEFLDWAHSRSDLFEAFSMRSWQIDGTTYFRSTVQAPSTMGYPFLIGCGRSTSPIESIAKACGELLERHTMYLYKIGKISPFRVKSLFLGGIFSNVHFQLPPNELITSNGWAVHPDIEKSTESALAEAIERHLIQQTFLKEEGFGFIQTEVAELDAYKVKSFISPYKMGGYSAGLVQVKSKSHPGSSYGYMSCSSNLIFGAEKWSHALFEAVEPIYFLDNLTKEELIKINLESSDFLEKRQIDYILRSDDLLEKCKGKSESDFIHNLDISEPIFSAEFNLSEIYQIPVKMFASYVFSSGFIPLWNPKKINEVSRKYLENTFSINQIEKEKINVEIPVI